MIQFLKYVLATIVGLFLFSVLSIFLLAGIGSAFSSSSSETNLADNSVLKIDLNQVVTENAADEDPFSEIFSDGPGKVGLVDIKESLANAKLDPNIKGVYLKIEYPMAGFATIEEIRNALIDFKKSKKFVYTYGEIMTEQAMYLASVADKSYINPAGGVEFNGLDAELIFFKKMFDKVGIKPVIFRVGEFKSAVEPFIRTDMSPENKEQVQSYLNSIANHMYKGISVSRGVEMAELTRLLNTAAIQSPQDAVKHKLLTHVGYFDEFEQALKIASKTNKKGKVSYVSLGKYKSAKKYVEKGNREQQIAVIVSEGEITSGEASSGGIGSDSFIKELIRARNDKKVKAIVLRINSPGGSALASDVMWREIELTKKEKPVIASMGDVAASGGYYMAMGCDTIVAQPTTITGSIGIFGMLFNVQELMNDKVGITFDVVKTHTFANSPSLTREMSDAEKMMIQNSVNQGYETFTTKAAKGRKMPVDKLKAIAGGRVWTGAQAKNNGLVDVLGGLEDAVAIAAKKAGIKENDYRVRYMPTPKSDFEQIMSKINGSGEETAIQNYFGVLAPIVKEVRAMGKAEQLQARLPYHVIIR
ncbi:MAG: signal peptide peptidase SppA [Spirosomataceae bacterium]